MDHLIKNRNVIKEMKRNKISHFLYLLFTLISTNQRELPMLRLVYKRLIETGSPRNKSSKKHSIVHGIKRKRELSMDD